jgi:protein SCO1/2
MTRLTPRLTSAPHRSVAALPLVVALLCVSAAWAQVPQQEDLAVQNRSPLEYDGVDVVEHLGERLPLDLAFRDEAGADVRLGDYFGQGKPVLITLVYFNCPMLCSMVLNGALEGMRELGWTPGEDFEVVTVSISPTETPELARDKKANYLERLGLPGADKGWHFLTGSGDNIKALAGALGFGYRYDPSTQDYAHGAAIFFAAADGVITRYLYGVQFPAKQLRLALVEAGRGEVGSVVDKVLMRCFMYEPAHKKYGFYIWGAMRLGGVLTIFILGGFLLLLWRGERRARSAGLPS